LLNETVAARKNSRLRRVDYSKKIQPKGMPKAQPKNDAQRCCRTIFSFGHADSKRALRGLRTTEGSWETRRPLASGSGGAVCVSVLDTVALALVMAAGSGVAKAEKFKKPKLV
jgi:hypothetical protein